MNSNILILVLLLIIVIFAICNVKKNKVYIIPLIISLLGIFNYSSFFLPGHGLMMILLLQQVRLRQVH